MTPCGDTVLSIVQKRRIVLLADVVVVVDAGEMKCRRWAVEGRVGRVSACRSLQPNPSHVLRLPYLRQGRISNFVHIAASGRLSHLSPHNSQYTRVPFSSIPSREASSGHAYRMSELCGREWSPDLEYRFPVAHQLFLYQLKLSASYPEFYSVERASSSHSSC